MVLGQIKNIPIILGSQSPRRRELLAAMDLSFEVEVYPTDESIGGNLDPTKVATEIALKKLIPFENEEYRDKLVITADTIVVSPTGEILGKPTSPQEAFHTIKKLNGQAHTVITGVGLRFRGASIGFAETTNVLFSELDDEEIRYYVEQYSPMDKAGSYGIQEWIGRIGIAQIQGSYENVMGLPTQRLYAELKKMFKKDKSN